MRSLVLLKYFIPNKSKIDLLIYNIYYMISQDTKNISIRCGSWLDNHINENEKSPLEPICHIDGDQNGKNSLNIFSFGDYWPNDKLGEL